RETVQADGSFTILGVPGPAVLVPCVSGDSSFPVIDARSELRKRGVYSWPSGPCHDLIEVNVGDKDPKARTFAIALRAGAALTGSGVGADGKPLAGGGGAGLCPAYTPPARRA